MHSQAPLAGDRTRRSYPSLQHISLAPLSTKFPVDDDAGDTDNVPAGDEPSYFTAHAPTASYLASSSVPTTPGILADSRNVSHTNLAKRKKLSIDGRPPLSDTQLDDMHIRGPLHHHDHDHDHDPQRSRHHRRSHSSRPKSGARRDSEWLMRAGLAMSSSAREEKGQSWLVKRESSTSLVSDAHQGDDRMQYPEYSRNAARKQRSGASTRAPPSRRPSVSQPGSRRTSRPDLGMTPRNSVSQVENSTPLDHGDIYPDFVDEAVQQKAASAITEGVRDADDLISNIASESEFSDSDSDEIDEIEMQRLTRQRGFGLGSWIDRLVEWTLFSVEEEYPATAAGSTTAASSSGSGVLSRKQTEEFQVQVDENEGGSTDRDSFESESEAQVSEEPVQVEYPGEEGGWADAQWLLGIVRRVVF